jgi:hypothetical protein
MMSALRKQKIKLKKMVGKKQTTMQILLRELGVRVHFLSLNEPASQPTALAVPTCL